MMLVHRSTQRPPPPKRDPFAGEIRRALGEAKARRKPPVTLPQLRALAKAQGEGGRA